MSKVKGFFKAIWRGWIKFGHILGKINQTIIMTLIYFTAIGLMGIFMRIFGSDPLSLKKEEKSYWKDLERHEPSIERYKRLG